MLYFNQVPMKVIRNTFIGIALVALATGPGAAEDQVAISSEVNIIADGEGEVVAIGGEVKVSGHSDDELVAIGGNVEVDVQAEAEAVIIGGQVEVRGAYAGELVIIGGQLDFYGANTEELVIFGGQVTVHEEAISGGPAVVFGGEVDLAGRFAQGGEFGGGHIETSGHFADDVSISAGEADISGEFYGNLEIEGETIRIKDGISITGHLTVRSPSEPVFDEGVELEPGAWTYEFIEEYDPKFGDLRLSEIVQIAGVIAVILGMLLLPALIVPLIVIVASGHIATNSAMAFRHKALVSFLIGLALVIPVCIVSAVLTMFLIGPYFLIGSIMLGFFVAAYSLSALLFRKVGVTVNTGTRFGYTVLGSLILVVLASIHWTGLVIVSVLVLFGSGAFTLALFNAAPKIEDIGPDGSLVEAFDDGHPRDPVLEEDRNDADYDDVEDDPFDDRDDRT